MPNQRTPVRGAKWPFLLVLALALPGPSRAATPVFRALTAADGLPFDTVDFIAQDRRGFLWLSSASGLARFDGDHFALVDLGPGIGSPSVRTAVADADGGLWLGTVARGVIHLSADGRVRRVFHLGMEPVADNVDCLWRDRSGRLWAGTDSGLFRLDDAGREFVPFEPRPARAFAVFASVAADARGDAWWGTYAGVMLQHQGTLDETVGRRLGVPGPSFHLLVGDDRLWIGDIHGLWCVRLPVPATTPTVPPRAVTLRTGGPVPMPVAPGEVFHYLLPDTSEYDVNALAQTADGTLWVATGRLGLLALRPERFTRYGTAQHLIDDSIKALLVDREGDLWVGTPAGAMMLPPHGFLAWGADEGLIDRSIVALLTDRLGRLCALGREDHLQCLRGDDLRSVVPNVPPPIGRVGHDQLLAQTVAGDWWVRAPSGLFHFPAGDELATLAGRSQRVGRAEGLPADRPSRVFLDTRGDLWVGVWDEGLHTVVRRDRRSGTLTPIAVPSAIGPLNPPTAFAESAPGTLWMGFYDGAVARYRGGRFDLVLPRPSRSSIAIEDLLVDGHGRLWVAAMGDGLWRIDEPAAAHPRVVRYGRASGLLSDSASCVTADRWGRVYVGSPAGVSRLDPQSGAIRQFTSTDGLARGGVEVCTTVGDRLWFGSPTGLVSLDPALEPPHRAPGVYINALAVAGVSRPLSPFGESHLDGLALGYPGHLQVEFASFGFHAAREARFQYRLNDGPWSRPSEQRSVNFEGLRGGAYTMLVRAVTADGRTSPVPARLGFRVVPPWWLQPWFPLALALLVAVVVAAGVRARVAALLRLERMRTRIAADLHDEVGASLSWIARLSDLATDRLEPAPASAREMLSQIGEVSRQLIDSTSDIVWAIDPRRDDLASVFVRLRRLATDLLAGQGSRLHFAPPPDAADVTLDAGRRRELYLLLKEAIHNVSKHAGAANVEVRSVLGGGSLTIEVINDGRGFDLDEPAGQGQGLDSMRRRAAALGARLQIAAERSRGTRVRLEVPL